MKQPIFQSIFGQNWDQLPAVFKKHYANRAHTQDKVRVEGKMSVKLGGMFRYFSFTLGVLKLMPPYEGEDVAVSVDYESHPSKSDFTLHRLFSFPQRKPYLFRSTLVSLGGNQLVEVMRYGIGWRLSYHWEDNKVKLKHQGYVLRCFGGFLPLPISWLFGKGYAEEWEIDGDRFGMLMEIRHPVFGVQYRYDGAFKVTEMTFDAEECV